MTTVTAAAQTQVLSTAEVMETWNPYASRASPTEDGQFMANGVLHAIAPSWVSMTPR